MLFCLSCLPLMAQDWPSAKPEAKPGLRWWWLGSAVDKDNLAWSLQEYARCGAGAVEITPIYGVQGNEKNDICFLSDRWMEMLRFTEEEARKNGIEVDMNTGTGWPFGGPWVPLEESASKMVVVDTTAAGSRVKGLDVTPPNLDGKTKLLCVMAFGEGAAVHYSDSEHIKLSEDGHAIFDARLPKKGTWRIIALWQQQGVMTVSRAAPGDEGYVIDHFSRQSVKHFLKHIEDAFERTGTPYPHTMFNDSYEVEDSDFTPGIFDEFQSRRGYSLYDSFDKLIDGDPKVVSDYRETLGDMLLENFTETWTAWAHRHGSITRNQAHGSPANLLDCYAAVDIPEIEGFGFTDFGIKGLRKDPGFTRENYSDFSMYKYASSAAHVTGKPFTSSETFTWLTEHFRTSLSEMKPDLDLMFCAGVNHVFFHGTAYSPKDEPWPGRKFYASIDMSPTNTIWKDAPWLMRYITLCQRFLQWGEPDNDFLCYLPIHDMWAKNTKNGLLMQFAIEKMKEYAPEFVKAVDRIVDAGYDCDYISDRQLLSTHCEDGKIVTSAGTRYKALVIPYKDNMLTEELRKHIEELEGQGAQVIFGIDALEMGKAARPEKMKSEYGLRMLRRRNGMGHHYFICNLAPEDFRGRVPLAVDFSEAMWFDPMTGDRFSADASDGSVAIDLRSGESLILETFDEPGHVPELPEWRAASSVKSFALDGPWKLSFKECEPVDSRIYDLEHLQSWENLDGTARTLMGTGVYEYALLLSDEDCGPDAEWEIDLGDVRESARVYVNDSLVGCAWAVPFTLRFKGCLHAGRNNIRVEVTNLPANRISQMDRDGVKWRRFKDINFVNIHYQPSDYSSWPPVPSGLNSTVTLYRRGMVTFP